MRYREIKAQVAEIHEAKGFGVARKHEDRKSGGLAANPQYARLKKELAFWENVYGFKRDLLNRYLTIHPDEQELPALNDETDHLALGIIEGIEKFRRSYKIGTFPIVHNLFIQMHLKKRGACKHWAEDLLTLINTMEHPHFTSLWAEAHPGAMNEHNVAVLVPRGADFREGLLIDPWRTAGKPFWTIVKKDSYPWQQWNGYQPR